MKRIIPILILSVLLGASCSKDKKAPTDETPADTLALLITGIQKCSKLYATECHVHKIITHKDKVKSNFTILNQEISLDVPVGVRKIAIPIDAVLKAYVNFDGFSEKNVQRNGEKIMITLPDPEIVLTSTKVNHAEMKQYVPLLRGNFSDEEMAGYINEGRAGHRQGDTRTRLDRECTQECGKPARPYDNGVGLRRQEHHDSFPQKLYRERFTHHH